MLLIKNSNECHCVGGTEQQQLYTVSQPPSQPTNQPKANSSALKLAKSSYTSIYMGQAAVKGINF